MKCLIIDDEPLARDIIKSYLKEIPDFEVIEECADGFEGVKAIAKHKPDLIFLDIQMPKLTGFEMLELIDETPKIIFTTAYDEYAIKAFEQNAVDYLLKPFSKERFLMAINKIPNKIINEQKINKIKDYLNEDEKLTDRIVVKSGSKIVVIPLDSVFYFEAQDDYVMIYSEQGRFLKQKTMKYFEKALPYKDFVRVHRSYIINLGYIDSINLYEKESYSIKLKNGSIVKASKSGYKNLKEKLAL